MNIEKGPYPGSPENNKKRERNMEYYGDVTSTKVDLEKPELLKNLEKEKLELLEKFRNTDIEKTEDRSEIVEKLKKISNKITEIRGNLISKEKKE